MRALTNAKLEQNEQQQQQHQQQQQDQQQQQLRWKKEQTVEQEPKQSVRCFRFKFYGTRHLRSRSSPARSADREIRTQTLGQTGLVTPLNWRGHCEWRNALTIVLAIRFLAQNKFGLKQTAETDGAHRLRHLKRCTVGRAGRHGDEMST